MKRETKTQRLLQTGARWLVIVAVVLAPWLFGSTDAWAHLFIGSLVGLGGLVWLLSQLLAQRVEIRAPMLTAILLLLILFVGVQACPLPARAVHLLNPFAARLHNQTSTLLTDLALDQISADDTAVGTSMALSVSPSATRRALYLVVAYALTFLIMANTTRHWVQLRHACLVLVGSATLMTIVAIVHKLSGSAEIYWFHAPRYGGYVFGPFTNRNHLAAHLNMVFGMALGLFASTRRAHELVFRPDWRDSLRWLSGPDAGRTILLALVLLLLAGAVGVSLSRGALLSLVGTLALFGFAAIRRRPIATRHVAGFAVMMLVLVVTIFWFGSNQLVDRIGELAEVARNPTANARFVVTRDTLKLFAVCPLFGCGFGAFRHTYSMFQTPSLAYRWLHAHNDWAQLLAEGATLGGFLFVTLLLLWVRDVRRCRQGGSRRAGLLVAGLLFGLTTITLHSFVDYSLHKPANAFLLAAMAGMATGGVRIQRGGQALEPPGSSGPAVHTMARIGCLAASILLTLLLLDQQRVLRGEMAFPRFLYLARLADRATGEERVAAVLEAERDARIFREYAWQNPDGLAEIATVLHAWSQDMALDRGLRVRLLEDAAEFSILAVKGAPSDYLPWLWLGRTQMALGHWREAEAALVRARELVLHAEQVRMFQPIEVDEDRRNKTSWE